MARNLAYAGITVEVPPISAAFYDDLRRTPAGAGSLRDRGL